MIMIAFGSVSAAPVNRTSAKGTNFVGFQLDVPGYQGRTDKLNCVAYGKIMEAAVVLQIGQTVQVSGVPSAKAREYNGKTYANLTCLVNQIELAGNGRTQAPAPAQAPRPAQVPMAQQQPVPQRQDDYQPGEDRDQDPGY